MKREDFLKTGILGTAALGSVMIGMPALNSKATGQSKDGTPKTTWPWPYPATGLDASLARIRAHDAYFVNGCCYATFEAIIAGLRDTIGTPYNDLPTELMIFGSGGGGGWGATCGTINGASAAISLVCAKAIISPMVSELFGWFTQTLFPTIDSNTIAMNNGYTHNDYNMNLPQEYPGSPLCHAASSAWCNSANFGVGSNERKERCARMCGDVAYKAVELLNAQFSTSTFPTTYVPPALNATCLACHGSTGMQADVSTKMECEPCHGPDVYPHSTSLAEPSEINLQIDKNFPNPFNQVTTLEITLHEGEDVTVEVYNLNGQKITTLVKDLHYPPGTYKIEWDGRSANGNSIDSGMYFFSVKTPKSTQTISVMKM